ncbi:MAG: nitrogen fixation protein NifQ [Acetobacteraceae bacterium]|nr:nitrogen fixation protein NifQ [Acetobacteraceae bacterium]
MQPTDIYAWLTAHPNLGCDGFDTHVTASILALSLWESEAGRHRVVDAVGLDGDVLADLAAGLFPHTTAMFGGLRGQTCSNAADDETCLRDLLRRSTTHGTPFQCQLADMVARRCMRPNHLWQDLGFRNRRELGWMLMRHFEPLAERNRADMKWKKFFYRTICRDEGYMLCAAPSCAECDDFDNCFGEEGGESLLAQARRATDRAA